jgi:hypothetical protein
VFRYVNRLQKGFLSMGREEKHPEICSYNASAVQCHTMEVLDLSNAAGRIRATTLDKAD